MGVLVHVVKIDIYVIHVVTDSQSNGNHRDVIPGSISEGSVNVAFKLDLQGQEIAAEVYEQFVLQKTHDHSSVEGRLEWSKNGRNKL